MVHVNADVRGLIEPYGIHNSFQVTTAILKAQIAELMDELDASLVGLHLLSSMTMYPRELPT